MEKLTYQQLLLQSQKDKEKEEILFAVAEKELDLKLDMLATQKSLAAKKSARSKMLGTIGLSFSELSKLDDEIEALERGEKRLLSYMSELFPDDLL